MVARFPDLAGKTAVVTGTSHGIGCGIAEVLAEQGMALVLAARSKDRGLAFCKLLRKRGATCTWVTADLTEREDAKRVLESAAELGGVDLLVNNAAIMGSSMAFDKLTPDVYERSFEMNVRILYHVSHLAANAMIEADAGGSIVNISSVGGLRAHRNMSGYDAAKGAMDAFTRAMALELAPHGIRVNGIAPGAIARYDPVGDSASRPDRRPADGIPLGRIGTAHEVGQAVAWIASGAASYVTGQTIYVDGGLTTQLTPPGIFI
jgi:3-oxoacyl-[acyl-carrier protein] reductase